MYFKLNKNKSVPLKKVSAKLSFDLYEKSRNKLCRADSFAVGFVGNKLLSGQEFALFRTNQGVKSLHAWNGKLALGYADRFDVVNATEDENVFIRLNNDGNAQATFDPITKIGIYADKHGGVCTSSQDNDSTEVEVPFSCVGQGAYRLWGGWQNWLCYTDICEYGWYLDEEARQNKIVFENDVRSVVGYGKSVFVLTEDKLYRIDTDADFAKFKLTLVASDFGSVVGSSVMQNSKLYFATTDGICTFDVNSGKIQTLLSAQSFGKKITAARFGVCNSCVYASLCQDTVLKIVGAKVVQIWNLSHNGFVADVFGVYVLRSDGIFVLSDDSENRYYQSAPCDLGICGTKTVIGMEICTLKDVSVTVQSSEGSFSVNVLGGDGFTFVPLTLRGETFTLRLEGTDIAVEYFNLVATATKED